MSSVLFSASREKLQTHLQTSPFIKLPHLKGLLQMDISGKGLPRWSHDSPWHECRLYFPMRELHCYSGQFFIKKKKKKREIVNISCCL